MWSWSSPQTHRCDLENTAVAQVGICRCAASGLQTLTMEGFERVPGHDSNPDAHDNDFSENSLGQRSLYIFHDVRALITRLRS
jgi:hypothetical protein